MFFYLDISLVQQALYKQSMLVRKSQNNQFKFSETPPPCLHHYISTIFPCKNPSTTYTSLSGGNFTKSSVNSSSTNSSPRQEQDLGHSFLISPFVHFQLEYQEHQHLWRIILLFFRTIRKIIII